MSTRSRTTLHVERAGAPTLLDASQLEARLQDACTGRGGAHSFALVHVQLTTQGTGQEGISRVTPVLASNDVVAARGDEDIQILLAERSPEELIAICAAIKERLAQAGVAARAGFALHPTDGRTADVLLWTAAGRAQSSTFDRFDDEVVAVDPATREVYALAQRVAAVELNVLIQGETGTGKDVLARTVHRLSRRADRQFLGLNCAALSESLLESELFGHERGAFTGAVGAKVGLLESAPGGTVFLDEVGELPLAMQAKLLRVIEAREILRVGALRVRPIDVRFVAATNRDLAAEVARGRFREDLYFRLNGFALHLPPLRERRLDILPLAARFLEAACRQMRRTPVPRLSPEAAAVLERHPWPGNARELRNTLERALVLGAGAEILPRHLGIDQPTTSLPRPVTVPLAAAIPPTAIPVAAADEQTRIREALAACGGNQTRAARMLGMPRRTFLRRLDEYEIRRPRDR